tara:strand:- start:19 stop:525 length:507 start_codon:yes stop_codon:yes gene_type:complete
MRKYLNLLTLLILIGCSKKNVVTTHQPLILNEQTRNLIGIWEFVKILDQGNNKVDTIWHGMGFEIANGPELTYKEDGTYVKKFTPVNSDSGRWNFDKNSSSIIHQLYIDSTNWIGQDLIEKGLAVKFDNGLYYEQITDKVNIISDSEMAVYGRNNIRRIYYKQTSNRR